MVLTESYFQRHKEECEIVPENDSQSIRLRLILKDILDALHKDIKNNWHGVLTTTNHLDGLHWGVMLVCKSNRPDRFMMYSIAGAGKIVVNTNILQHFIKDDEIATMIGHEVGHVVARHVAEILTEETISRISHQLIGEPPRYQKRIEIEADFIGLMLMASAGYDPRIVPEVFKKLGSLSGNDKPSSDPLSTHPCGEERARLLNQVMDKALAIYKKVKATHSIQLRKEGGLILTPKKVEDNGCIED